MNNKKKGVHNYSTENRKKIMSKRNLKIISLYKHNYTMKEIADMIGVSATTVFFAIRGR